MRKKRADSNCCLLVPASMSLLFLFLFFAYSVFVPMVTLEPNYYVGLVYLIPAVILALVAFFGRRTHDEKSYIISSVTITIVFLILAVLLSVWVLFVDTIETETTDKAKYERVLQLNHYPDNPIITHFPAEIPVDAQEVQFYYLSSISGTTLALKYEISEDMIDHYKFAYERMARWSGQGGDAESKDFGIFPGTLHIFDNAGHTPNDQIVYVLFYQRGNQLDNNHGQRCIVTISQSEKQIMFQADTW